MGQLVAGFLNAVQKTVEEAGLLGGILVAHEMSPHKSIIVVGSASQTAVRISRQRQSALGKQATRV
jgi:hypothetical protein